jgi:hypothetical protein
VWQHRFPGSGKPNIRSYQQVGLAHIDTEIAPGENAEQRGLLAEAYHHYDSAMRGFVHPDLGLGVSLPLVPAPVMRSANSLTKKLMPWPLVFET